MKYLRLLSTISLSYLTLFLMYHVLIPGEFTMFGSVIFEHPLIVVIMFLALLVSTHYIGKESAVDDAIKIKQQTLYDLLVIEQRLISYITIARTITKDNAEDLVTDYVKKVTDKYKLGDKND